VRPSVNEKPGTAAGLLFAWVLSPGSDSEEAQDQDGAEQAQDKARDDGHRHHLDTVAPKTVFGMIRSLHSFSRCTGRVRIILSSSRGCAASH